MGVPDKDQPAQTASPAPWTSGMAWAVRRESREPVYIGRLNRSDKGLACDCICPACDARLQAVAPGMQATSSRVPFFRHHQAQQGPGCKHRMAELTALRLFAERGIIEIPAPRGCGAVVGISGKLYEKARVGEAIVEKVVERRAISEIEVELTLESGRLVILTLRGEQHLGELGSAHAVIQIHVTDPEVAMMTEDQILEHARISPRFLQLIAHADKSQLDMLAADDARQEALERLDIAPDDIHMPVGATPKQASESLLHWAVKNALASLGYLRAPAFRHIASALSADGKLHTTEVTLPELTLELSDVRWEVPHEGFRPDIVCWATDRQGGLGSFQLLIEVAKTSTVTMFKLARIRAARMACLQIDVYKFASSGQILHSEVQPLVAGDVSSKEWLCHPVLDKLIAEAEAKVADASAKHDQAATEAARRVAEDRAREELERERVRREGARRRSWAEKLSQAEALRELRSVLERRWTGELEITSNGMQWGKGELEACVQHLWLADRVPKWITDRGGLAWRISQILAVSYGTLEQLDFRTTFLDWSEVPWTRADESWLGLLHAIVQRFHASPFPLQYHAYAAHRDAVLNSLRSGDTTYARTTADDGLLAEMFPEIVPVLRQKIGTVDYALEMQKKYEKELAAQRAEQDAHDEEEQKRRLAEQAEASRRRTVEQAAYSMMWNSAASAPSTPERVLQCLKVTGSGTLEANWIEVILNALRAKLAGDSLDAWIYSQNFRTTEDALEAMRLLRNAYLAKSK